MQMSIILQRGSVHMHDSHGEESIPDSMPPEEKRFNACCACNYPLKSHARPASQTFPNLLASSPCTMYRSVPLHEGSAEGLLAILLTLLLPICVVLNT